MATKRLMLTQPIACTPPLVVEKWQTAHREDGRRLVVKDAAGAVAFDSGDHLGVANAFNSFDHWFSAAVAAGTYTLRDE